MARTKKNYSDDLKERIVRAHKNGMGYVAIQKMFEVPKSSVRDIINRFNQRGSVTNKKSTGQPRKTSATDDRNIIRQAKKNPRITLRYNKTTYIFKA